MRRLILVFAIAASMSGMLFTASASAQVVPPSLVGERVRLTVPRGFQPLTGRVVRIEEGHLVLETETGGPMQIPLSEIERLEVSLGTRSHAGKGAWIGALAGFGAGAVFGLLVSSAYDEAAFFGTETDSSEKVLIVSVYGLYGAAGGALVGVAIGAMSKSERWTDVPRHRWSLSVGVQRGVQVGLRIAL